MITSGICSNCHALGDESPENPVGPNLTHLFSRSVFAGATYDLTEANIRRWLTENDDMKPGNDMSVNLTQDDVDALMAYLTTLK
jgi:cytochrome c oxidase subunit 2